MSQNSYTPTEESTKITSTNGYDAEFEEEEEEYQYEDVDPFQLKYSRYKDPRDKIIMDNQRKIQKMQKAFKQTVKEMRANLAEICEQSSKLQFAMLDRILQLKQKIREINERNDFCRRALPNNRTKVVKKKSTKKKSKAKKRVVSQPQVPEVVNSDSGESF